MVAPSHSRSMKASIQMPPNEWVLADYNDIAHTAEVLSHLPDSTLAAILVEPTQVAAGTIPSRHDFLQFLRDTATKLGAVLIFDEVTTSRLSCMQWTKLQAGHTT